MHVWHFTLDIFQQFYVYLTLILVKESFTKFMKNINFVP